MRLILLALSLGLISCASLEQELDPKIYYENTLAIKVKVNDDTYKFRGVGVLPNSLGEYNIDIKNPLRGKLDFVKFSTCHRERTFTAEGKSLNIRFTPSPIERHGSCLIKFEAYSVKGKHGWGILDYNTHRERLQGKLRCNGYVNKGSVLMCQSRFGLRQQISFSEEVTVVGQSSGCRITEAGKYFKLLQFNIPRRECVFAFFSRSGERLRLTTIGYENVLIPSE